MSAGGVCPGLLPGGGGGCPGAIGLEPITDTASGLSSRSKRTSVPTSPITSRGDSKSICKLEVN